MNFRCHGLEDCLSHSISMSRAKSHSCGRPVPKIRLLRQWQVFPGKSARLAKRLNSFSHQPFEKAGSNLPTAIDLWVAVGSMES